MTFRAHAVQRFIKRLGEPDAITEDRGMIYRWKLPRENNLDLHIIIDTPENTWECHVLVSDPCPWVEEPVRTFRIQKEEEVEPFVQSIEDQWKLRDCWARPREPQA